MLKSDLKEDAEILKEILGSKAVAESIREVWESINKGEPVFTHSKELYGFGENCYYKSKRALVEDSVDEFFADAKNIPQSPTLIKRLLREVTDDIKYAITTWKDVEDHLENRFGTLKVVIEVEYEDFTNSVERDMNILLKREPDELLTMLVDELNPNKTKGPSEPI